MFGVTNAALNRKDLVSCQLLIFPSWHKHITNAHQEETKTAHQKEINTAAHHQKETNRIAHQEKYQHSCCTSGRNPCLYC